MKKVFYPGNVIKQKCFFPVLTMKIASSRQHCSVMLNNLNEVINFLTGLRLVTLIVKVMISEYTNYNPQSK